MARIRTVKPEFWTDDRLGECSVSARLLFIATWNFADDSGGLERSAKQLKAQAFPYDNLDCEALIQELLGTGCLIEYESGGKKYLHIRNFRKHQRIERPAQPRYPVYEESMRTQRVNSEPSPSTQCEVTVSSLEGNGKEGRGRERESFAPPPGLDLGSFSKWSEYRTQIGKPLAPASLFAAQRKLAAFGAEQAAVVEQSIANGWHGLFHLKTERGAAKSGWKKPRSIAELEAEEAARGRN